MEKQKNSSLAGIGKSVRLPVLASFGFTAVSLLSKLILLIFTPILTRLLSASDYGVYTLYASWIGIFSVLCTWDVTGGTLYRGLQKWGRENAPTFLFSAALFCLIPFFFVLVLSCLFQNGLCRFLGLPTLYLFFLFVEVFGEALLSFSSASCRYYSHPLRHAVSTLSLHLFSLIFTILLIRIAEDKAQVRVAVTSILTFLVGMMATFFLFRKKKPSFSIEVWRFLCRFSLPLFPHALCLCLLFCLGRLSVGRYLGTAALSSFGMAYSIGMAPCFLTVGIQSTYQPWLLRKMAAGEKNVVVQMTLALSFFIAAVCFSVVLISPEVFRLLVPDSYERSTKTVAVLSLSVLPLFLFNVTAAIELYYEKTRRLILATLPATLVSLFAFLFFVPKYGVRAAALLTPVSYILLLLFHTVTLTVTAKETLFPMGLLAILYASFSALTAASVYLSENPMLRAASAFVFTTAALFFLYRRKDVLLEPKPAREGGNIK